ncbi:PREDICTED: uncharacterized protein LOC108518362 [Rhinopithecus bieti]|uniref:uncharacterized protein LOC108518362 n=1 Tax=Rhinopithecus bieti TaxID=61621 RepID=UPI00083C8BE8|nr:PREDICTED: uncharacterized protein LOC108518362 [Rhinopithecus bieti]
MVPSTPLLVAHLLCLWRVPHWATTSLRKSSPTAQTSKGLLRVLQSLASHCPARILELSNQIPPGSSQGEGLVASSSQASKPSQAPEGARGLQETLAEQEMSAGSDSVSSSGDPLFLAPQELGVSMSYPVKPSQGSFLPTGNASFHPVFLSPPPPRVLRASWTKGGERWARTLGPAPQDHCSPGGVQEPSEMGGPGREAFELCLMDPWDVGVQTPGALLAPARLSHPHVPPQQPPRPALPCHGPEDVTTRSDGHLGSLPLSPYPGLAPTLSLQFLQSSPSMSPSPASIQQPVGQGVLS